MEEGVPRTGDTTPESDSEGESLGEDLATLPSTGSADSFLDRADPPEGTFPVAEPQRRRIAPTRVMPNPIAESQHEELVRAVGVMADATAQPENVV